MARKIVFSKQKECNVKRKGVLVKLSAWQKLPETTRKYGANAAPKKAGLPVHEAADAAGKMSKWVFVPKRGPDMMDAELVDKYVLADNRTI
eukprot:13142051-Alexandrium_andersonii.AAC.1